MPRHRIFAMPFARIYPLYVEKVERKGRTVEELDEVRGTPIPELRGIEDGIENRG